MFPSAVPLLFAAALASSQDWPRFRGPSGSGVAETSGLPAQFGPARNVIWKTAVPFSRSSPVIAGDRIFLTAFEGDKLVTLCLDRDTGHIRWRRDLLRARDTAIFKSNDASPPSPVTDGENVYVFFSHLGLISFTADGAERWRLPLGPFDSFYGIGASPILAGDTLLLLCDTRTRPFLLAV